MILIAQLKDRNSYLLKEIYWVKEKLFSLDYGIWNNNSGLIISESPTYVRRFNLNNTEVQIDMLEPKVFLIY